MNNVVQLSVIIPVLNEEENIPLLYEELKEVLEDLGISYEVVFVDDGSTDGSFSELEKLHSKDKSVRVFQFRRNFGKSEALSLGFRKARGEIIVTMDADLQDSPSEIPRLLDKIGDNDLVVGWRADRKDPFIKKFFSKIFNILICFLSGLRTHDANCGLKAMKKDVVGDIYLYGELHRYIPVMAYYMGYRVGEVPVKHYPRKFGKSKYDFSRLLKGFLDFSTIEFLSLYSRRPLHLFGSLGLLSFLFGIVTNLYLLYIRYFQGILIGNHPMLILGVLLLIIGVQFFFMGLLGEMIANIPSRDRYSRSVRRSLE